MKRSKTPKRKQNDDAFEEKKDDALKKSLRAQGDRLTNVLE